MTTLYEDVTMPGIPERFFDTIPEKVQQAAMQGDERRRIIKNPRTGNWMLVVRCQEVEPWVIGLDDHAFTQYDPKKDVPVDIDPTLLKKILWSMDTYNHGGPEKVLEETEKHNDKVVQDGFDEAWAKCQDELDTIDKMATRSSKVMPKLEPETTPSLVLPPGYDQ